MLIVKFKYKSCDSITFNINSKSNLNPKSVIQNTTKYVNIHSRNVSWYLTRNWIIQQESKHTFSIQRVGIDLKSSCFIRYVESPNN